MLIKTVPMLLIALSMMSGAALAAEMLPAPPETATPPAPPTPPPPENKATNAEDQKVVCKKIDPPVGTRVGGKRVCHTVADWRRLQEASQEVVEDVQKRDAAWNPPGG
jgi:hypothetical protein